MHQESKAYMRMCESINKPQRRKWNQNKLEMTVLADRLRDFTRQRDVTENHHFMNQIDRLYALIGQLPMFHEDGEGFTQSGDAIEEF